MRHINLQPGLFANFSGKYFLAKLGAVTKKFLRNISEKTLFSQTIFARKTFQRICQFCQVK